MDVRIGYEEQLSLKEKIQNTLDLSEETIIKDQLDGEIENWCSRKTVFIAAQTGAGKTTFIENKLVSVCQKENKKILIVSNRLVLSRQIKVRLAERLNQSLYQKFTKYLKKGMPEEIDEHEEIGCVKIVTYQSLVNFIDKYKCKPIYFFKEQESESTYYIDDIKYVVFDEAHYFLEDAIFNEYTELCLDKIIEKFNSKIRIYMSATLDDVMEIIYDKEEKYFNNKKRSPELCDGIKCENNLNNDEENIRINNCLYLNSYKFPCYYRVVLYEFQYDYSKYIPHFFNVAHKKNENNIQRKNGDDRDSNRNFDELLTKIEKSSGKWFIYVSRKKDGEDLEKSLNDAVFISKELVSQDKNDKKMTPAIEIYNEIIAEEKFSKRILISTKILDNGINLSDSEITNIAIMSIDRTEFLQALGRVRKCNSDKINLYIVQYNKKSLNGMLSQIVRDLKSEARYKAFCVNKGEKFNKVPNHAYLKNVSTDGNTRFAMEFNYLAMKKLQLVKTQLEDLLQPENETDFDSNYKNIILSWLQYSLTWKELETERNKFKEKMEENENALKQKLLFFIEEQKKLEVIIADPFMEELKIIFSAHEVDYNSYGKTEGRDAGKTILNRVLNEYIGYGFSVSNDKKISIYKI